MPSNLFNLPDITFLDGDAADVERRIIITYEETAGRSLAKGDPVRLFLESVAAVIIQQRELIDWAAKQNLLAYASGGYLDHLGALLGVERLPAARAVTTLRFSISAVQAFPVLVPQGTRASPDRDLVFATTEAAVIPAGSLSVDVPAQCETAGEAGNGYVAGQIDEFVDPVAYIEKVVNISDSTGGADTESDDNLRTRINLAPESFSVAGSAGSYEYWAKTAHQGIADVAVLAPANEPGHVYIYPLMTGGELPSQEICALVDATCSAEKVRPLTDTVHVQAPTPVEFALTLTYYIKNSDSTLSAEIRAAVATAVSEYAAWQCEKIGRDLNPSELVRRVMAAGALRVVVTAPVHTVLTASQVAQLSDEPTLTFGGFEDG